MKWLLCFLCSPLFAAGPLIIDHTRVADYASIPQWKIDIIKTQWCVYAGESHSRSLHQTASKSNAGMYLLNLTNATFASIPRDDGSPVDPTTNGLRVSPHTRVSSAWDIQVGEEDLWTSDTALQNLTNNLYYCNVTLNNPIRAYGFGWCWDMYEVNFAGSGSSPNGVDTGYGCHWCGRTKGSADGEIRWGIDGSDYDLTGNRVSLTNYLWAMHNAQEYVASNGWPTHIMLTTGPSEATENSKEEQYQMNIKNWHIRDFATNHNMVLFDFLDILAWSNAGDQQTFSHTDSNGQGHNVQRFHNDNLLNMDGSDGVEGNATLYHFGERGALRLAKAMWVLMADLIDRDAETATAPKRLNAGRVTVGRIGP